MEVFRSVCKNPWCKAQFTFTELNFIVDENGNKSEPTECRNCIENSQSVTWTDKKYEGDLNWTPMEFKSKINKYF